jgi:hypothetical protein
MKVGKKEVVEINLTLTYQEAHWLMGMVQNCLHGNLDDEDPKDTEMRLLFWKSLESQGVKP